MRQSHIEVGCIRSLFGTHGWLRIESYTQPIENILNYQPWQLILKNAKPQVVSVADSEIQAKGLVVQLVGYQDREVARTLLGARIQINRDQLPLLPEGQYYWFDLEGLEVKTLEGVSLGKVAYLFATSANDVLVVQGDKERFIPYLPQQVVKHVDLSKKMIQVDWDPEF